MVNNMIKKLTGTVSCDSALSRRAGQESLDLDLTVLRCRHPPPGGHIGLQQVSLDVQCFIASGIHGQERKNSRHYFLRAKNKWKLRRLALQSIWLEAAGER